MKYNGKRPTHFLENPHIMLIHQTKQIKKVDTKKKKKT